MVKMIRFPKQIFQYYGIERPWNDKHYVPFVVKFKDMTNGSLPDTAFGDRLQWWAHAFVIGRLTRFEWQLQFSASQYPEKQFFKFPKSIFLQDEDFYRGINQFKYLTQKEYNQLIHHEFIRPSLPDHLIINHFPMTTSFYGSDPLSLIELYYPEMKYDLKKLFGQYIGVHLRRFHGIYYDDTDLIELSPQLQEEYKKESRLDKTSWTWKYIKNQEYFNQLNQYDDDFYISTDLPEKYYYNQWSDRYPNRIYNMNHVLNEFNAILIRYYGDEFVKENHKLILRMIDYFALMYCKRIVCPMHYKAKTISSWSETAHRISSVPITIFKAGYL